MKHLNEWMIESSNSFLSFYIRVIWIIIVMIIIIINVKSLTEKILGRHIPTALSNCVSVSIHIKHIEDVLHPIDVKSFSRIVLVSRRRVLYVYVWLFLSLSGSIFVYLCVLHFFIRYSKSPNYNTYLWVICENTDNNKNTQNHEYRDMATSQLSDTNL